MAGRAPPIVSAEWLHRQAADVKIIDASWYLPAMQRNGREEYLERRIPSAQFYDVDATDDKSNLPHMIPSADFFSRAISACGVSNSDHIVVYDGKGIFSGPRLWWLLRAFGHERVSVLDGGMPAWLAEGYAVESGPPQAEADGGDGFTATLDASAACDAAFVLRQVEAPSEPVVIVDARPAERFEGKVAEARAGCRSGHIPTSRNVPFTALLDPSTGKMKADAELRAVFDAAKVPIDASGPPLVLSCGSGVTAAVVQLALAHLGREERIRLYDGSWAEWGGDESKPLATGPASPA